MPTVRPTTGHHHAGGCGKTYDDLDRLPLPLLAIVVRDLSPETVALACAFQPPSFVARLSAAVPEQQRTRLAALLEAKQDSACISAAQDALMQALCDAFMPRPSTARDTGVR